MQNQHNSAYVGIMILDSKMSCKMPTFVLYFAENFEEISLCFIMSVKLENLEYFDLGDLTSCFHVSKFSCFQKVIKSRCFENYMAGSTIALGDSSIRTCTATIPTPCHFLLTC